MIRCLSELVIVTDHNELWLIVGAMTVLAVLGCLILFALLIAMRFAFSSAKRLGEGGFPVLRIEQTAQAHPPNVPPPPPGVP